MFRRTVIFSDGARLPRKASALFYVPGASLIAFGLLILVMPQLLVLLVSSFFILSGILLLSAGLTFNRLARHTAPRTEVVDTPWER